MVGGGFMDLSEKDKKAAQAFARLGGLKGGRARAEALTAEERRDIAREAANARWSKEKHDGSAQKIPQATHGSPDRPLRIGSIEIPCYVLDTGQRMVVQSGMIRALGMSHGGSGNSGGDRLAKFVAGKLISSYISKELIDRTHTPMLFRTPSGAIAYGYEAIVLADICEAVLEARRAGVLQAQQQHIAARCEILLSGFTRVGIIGLVDEATGYQEVRDRLALQAILDQYLRKEFAKWAKQFPLEFYQGIFRLRGWQWRGMKVNRPQIVAHYTTDLVYARLAPGLVKELEVRNPMTDRGYRKHKNYQYLTEDIGLPALSQHLYAVNGLMRAAKTWDEFMELMNKAHPRRGDTLELPFFEGDNFESVE
jgi:hypothetical protein